MRNVKGMMLLVLITSILLACVSPVSAYADTGFDFEKQTVEWERNHSMEKDQYLAITYGNGMYVAVGLDGAVATSVDGVDWTPRYIEMRGSLLSVCWNGKIFAAVGIFNDNMKDYGAVYTSRDGIHWTRRKLVYGRSLDRIAWNGKVFSVNCLNGIGYISEDGITWREFYTGVWGMYHIYAAGKRFFSIAEGKDLVYSDDGERWSKRRKISDKDISAMVSNGNLIVTVGYDGQILTSVDGMEWEKAYSPMTKGNLKGVAWNGKLFVAVGDGKDKDGGNISILTSKDGKQWIDQRNIGMDRASLIDVTWGGDRFAATCGGGKIISSQDGIKWELVFPRKPETQFSKIEYCGGRFVALGVREATQTEESRFIIATSEDGIEWTERYGSENYSQNALAWNGKTIVVVGGKATYGHGVIYTSTDGLTWTEKLMYDSPSLYNVFYKNGQFFAVTERGTVFCSVDGQKWETVETKVAGESDNTGISIVETNGKMFIAADSNGWLLQSADGKVWTKNSSVSDVYVSHIAWNGREFCAIGFGRTGGYSQGNTVTLTSADGAHWDVKKTGWMMSTRSNLKYIGGILMAFCEEGYSFISVDGRQWKMLDAVSGEKITDVAFNGSFLIAVGTDGTLLKGRITDPAEAVNMKPVPQRYKVSTWAGEAVEYFWKNRRVDEKFFGDYQKPVTREEFAMLVINTYESIEGRVYDRFGYMLSFCDTPESPYARQIEKAVRLNIAKGLGDGRFNPKGAITRQEISVMIFNFLRALYPLEDYNVTRDVRFVDDDKIADWARTAVLYLYKNNYIKGTGNLAVSPLDNATREQALTMIYNIMKRKGLL